MPEKKIETVCPASRHEWRQWLRLHHQSKSPVWLVYSKKACNVSTITWSEAVDEALCFGWIDSTKRPLDSETFMQYFCKRKPGSVWSKINKAKVERLIAGGLMMEAGFNSIKTARQNGSWFILDEVEELLIPEDLTEQFKLYPGAADFFLSLSKSVNKAILQWLVLAKRAQTRQKRITEIAELAAQRLKPQQFR